MTDEDMDLLVSILRVKELGGSKDQFKVDVSKALFKTFGPNASSEWQEMKNQEAMDSIDRLWDE